MYLYPSTQRFMRPVPIHRLRIAEREAAWRAAHPVPVDPLAGLEASASIVTIHPKPWAQIPVESLIGAPALFAKAALDARREVAARAAGDTVCVGVRAKGGLGVRAYWKAGRSAGVLVNGKKTTVAAAKAALS